MLEAATRRRKETLPHHSKATELQKDILNISSHVFGEHKKCKERGQNCEENREEIQNYVPYLKYHGARKICTTFSESIARGDEKYCSPGKRETRCSNPA